MKERGSEPRTVISLDGSWSFTKDPRNLGRRKEWFNGSLRGSTHMRVPSCWNERYPDYDRVAWYETEFSALPGWGGKHVTVRFEAVNYFAEVWINGTFVGQHEGGYTPFEVDATAALRTEGANLLTVRVVDTPKHGRLEGFTLKEVPCGKESWYQPIGGIWGSVALTVTERIRIRDVFVRPVLEDSSTEIALDVLNLLGKEAAVILRFIARLQGFESGAASGDELGARLMPGPNTIMARLPFSSLELWSPETPSLYVLESEVLVGGTSFDRCMTRFGFRELTVKDNRFHLNGSPIFLKGALQQGYYPRTIVFPPDRNFAREEIRLAKEAGFNLLRLHIKTYPPVVLDLADEMGMLLYEEPPIGWLKDSPQLKTRCVNEVKEMIVRDRNHPSIVIWGILNEGGTDDGTNHYYGVQFIKNELCMLARGLDPSRLIIDESGGVFGTNLYMPGSSQKWPYEEEHFYERVPVTEEIYEKLRGSGVGSPLFFLTELGCGGLGDLPSIVSEYDPKKEGHRHDYLQQKGFLDSLHAGLASHGLDTFFGGVSAACRETQKIQAEGMAAQVEAIRINPHAGGYILTELADCHSESSMGFLDHWRRPKELWNVLKRVNSPTWLAVRVNPNNCTLGDPVEIRVTCIDESDAFRGTEQTEFPLELQVMDSSGGVVHREHRRISLRPLAGDASGYGRLSYIPVLGAPRPPWLWERQSYLPVLGAPRPPWLWERLYETAPISLSTGVCAGAEGRYVVRLTLGPDKEGGQVVEGSDSFLVYDRRNTHLPRNPLRVVDPDFSITPWLKEQGIAFQHLGESSDIIETDEFAVVGRLSQDSSCVRAGAGLVQGREMVRAGGTALILECVPRNLKNFLFRNELWTKDCKGLLLGAFHYAKPHPIIFRDLPHGMLGKEYACILPDENIKEHNFPPGSEVIAGSFSQEGGGFVFQATIVAIPEGKGRYILSQFKLTERLGKDPVADRLFCNLIDYGVSSGRVS